MDYLNKILGDMYVMKGLSSGASYRELQRSIRPLAPLRHRIRDRIAAGRARTPKPEDMFRNMILAGEIKIVRRRFKPPLVVILKKTVKRRY